MLHILLMILKIIGITVLILLGTMLCLLFMILFVPIKYNVKGNKQEENLTGMANVNWLFGVITFSAVYRQKKLQMYLKIIGIDLLRYKKKKKDPVLDENSKKHLGSRKELKKENESKPRKEENQKGEIQKEEIQKEENQKGETQKEQSKTSKNTDKFEQGANTNEKELAQQTTKESISEKVSQKIEKIKLTIQNIYDKIDYWKTFLSEKRTKDAVILIKKHLMKLLKHILPRKVKGNIVYGFEDPYRTGQVLAGISAFYPLYYRKLTISPDFSDSKLEGTLAFKGRIFGIVVVKTALILFFNKNIQYIIYTIRNKEEA